LIGFSRKSSKAPIFNSPYPNKHENSLKIESNHEEIDEEDIIAKRDDNIFEDTSIIDE
jgi:hypothetical protein